MRPHRALAGPFTGAGHNAADRACPDGAHGRQHRQEHRPALRPRAPVQQVRGDRPTDVGRQRKAATAALAAHPQLARPPVEVAQLQARHLARTQAKANQQQQDRIVAQPGRL